MIASNNFLVEWRYVEIKNMQQTVKRYKLRKTYRLAITSNRASGLLAVEIGASWAATVRDAESA